MELHEFPVFKKLEEAQVADFSDEIAYIFFTFFRRSANQKNINIFTIIKYITQY